MEHILTVRMPLKQLTDWLGRLAIVADDDDGIETEYLPGVVQLERSMEFARVASTL